jgi:hypothetical protein
LGKDPSFRILLNSLIITTKAQYSQNYWQRSKITLK